jgi:hypothetical protein
MKLNQAKVSSHLMKTIGNFNPTIAHGNSKDIEDLAWTYGKQLLIKIDLNINTYVF